MRQPPGYVQLGKEELVCKLRKSINGLKQHPHCWNERLCDHLRCIGFKESGADPCVIQDKEGMKIVAVYVDNLIIKMKDMEKLRYCLGINFEVTEQGTSLS